MAQRKEKTIEQRISAEYKKLKKSVELPENDAICKIGDDLMQRAAFMKVTLEDLEAKIRENGCVSEYQNGANQWGTKKSPEVETYNTMIKNYAVIIRQISDLLPETSAAPADDGFDDFEFMRNG